MGGHKRRVLAGEQEWLLLRLEECPHLTVRRLALELADRGYQVSPNTVWSLLHKAGHSFKETLFAAEQDRRSPGGGRSGRSIRAGLIHGGSSSSTRPRWWRHVLYR
jgi:hypothetical protein